MFDACRAAVLSALLLVLAFPPYACWPAAFVAFVPLLEFARRRTAGPRCAGAWLCGALVHLVGTAWVLPALAGLQKQATAMPAMAFVLYAASQGTLIGLWGMSVCRRAPSANREPGLTSAFRISAGVAGTWVVLEALLPRIVPWSLADVLTPARHLRQAADLCGAPGLSFVVVLVNGLLGEAVGWRALGRRKRLLAGGSAVLLVVLVHSYGVVRLRAHARETAVPPATATSLRVAAVQGNVLSNDGEDEGNWQAWSTYAGLTRSGLRDAVDLAVWPETTLRTLLRHDRAYRSRVVGLARELQCPLLLGALDGDLGGEVEMNAAYLVQAHGGAQAPAAAGDLCVYHKRALVPFAEYLPRLGRVAAAIGWRTTGRFVPGVAGEPMRMRMRAAPHGRPLRDPLVSTSICFEAIRPGAFNEAVRAGAGLLVNLSDDSWAGGEHGSEQHLQAVVLRAVETRRWLVRASNSGVTAVVGPTGEVVASLPYGQTGVLRHTVRVRADRSPYVRYGDWFLLPCALFAACAQWKREHGRRVTAD